MSKYTISVVIPTYQRPDLLDKLLTSIYQAERPKSIIEIIVVENGGLYDAENVCQNWQSKLPIIYLYNPEAGVSGARNTGSSAATGDIVLFFDDDIRCDKNIFITYDEAIQRNGTQYFYGGCLEIDYEKKPSNTLLKFLPDSVKGMHLYEQETIISEGLFLGANHAIPKKLFNETIQYDQFCSTDTLDAIGEETRLQDQLINNGTKGLYLPDAKVWHFVPEKRCNLEWATNRRYRYGLTQGILQANKGCSKNMLFGIPAWVIREQIKLSFQVLLTNTFQTPNDENRIKNTLKLAEIKGLRDGYKKEVPN